MSSGHLRERDLDLLFRVLEEGRRDDPAVAVPWALLQGLQRLIPCDLGVSYQHHRPAARVTPLIQATDLDGCQDVLSVGPEPPDEPFWRLWPTSWCSWPQRTGDLRSVLHTGDFLPTERARRADPMAQALSAEDGLRYCMVVSLPAPPGEARRLVFRRSAGPPFSERDRQVAALARPHVQEIWLDAQRRRQGVPRLSRREWEVLERAAQGMSYAEIAEELFVSVATVRKHMEHVRERLGVHSVMAAAAQALPRPSGPGDGRADHLTASAREPRGRRAAGQTPAPSPRSTARAARAPLAMAPWMDGVSRWSPQT